MLLGPHRLLGLSPMRLCWLPRRLGMLLLGCRHGPLQSLVASTLPSLVLLQSCAIQHDAASGRLRLA
jgi:hypothetical protein